MWRSKLQQKAPNDLKATDLPSVIIPAALDLYDSIVDKTKMVRKLGYDFTDIKSDTEEQIDFFTDTVKAGREKSWLLPF